MFSDCFEGGIAIDGSAHIVAGPLHEEFERQQDIGFVVDQ